MYVGGVYEEMEEILIRYREDIKRVEKEYLEEKILSLMTIKYKLNDYYTVLPQIRMFWTHLQ